MCFDQTTTAPKKLPSYGWKYFRLVTNSNKIRLWHQYLSNHKDIVPVGKWLTSSKGLLWTKLQQYRTGFHCCLTRKAIQSFLKDTHIEVRRAIIRRVAVRDVRAFGKQRGQVVFTCGQMKVLPIKRKID
jgi:hypothetical protein